VQTVGTKWVRVGSVAYPRPNHRNSMGMQQQHGHAVGTDPRTGVVRQPGVGLPEVVKHLDAAIRPPALLIEWVEGRRSWVQKELQQQGLAGVRAAGTNMFACSAPSHWETQRVQRAGGSTTAQRAYTGIHWLACSTMEGAEYISPATYTLCL